MDKTESYVTEFLGIIERKYKSKPWDICYETYKRPT